MTSAFAQSLREAQAISLLTGSFYPRLGSHLQRGLPSQPALPGGMHSRPGECVGSGGMHSRVSVWAQVVCTAGECVGSGGMHSW
ncbi:hypothetical protein HispidOSU_007577 [Sigmodon hispidus]